MQADSVVLVLVLATLIVEIFVVVIATLIVATAGLDEADSIGAFDRRPVEHLADERALGFGSGPECRVVDELADEVGGGVGVDELGGKVFTRNISKQFFMDCSKADTTPTRPCAIL